MILTIFGVLLAVVAIFCAYAATRKADFRYERSGVIKATPETIYPYLSDLKRGGEWSPFEAKDPLMIKNFGGLSDQVGGIMDFDGGNEAGVGSLEILKLAPYELVELRLLMRKPIKGDNLVRYKLEPVEGGTKFTWEMSGKCSFIGKVMNVFMDCEKMCGDEFLKGIATLKRVIEGPSAEPAAPSEVKATDDANKEEAKKE